GRILPPLRDAPVACTECAPAVLLSHLTPLPAEAHAPPMPGVGPGRPLPVRAGNAARPAHPLPSLPRTEGARGRGARPPQGRPELHHRAPHGTDPGTPASALPRSEMTARILADGYSHGNTGENPRHFPHSDSRLFLI